MPKTATELKVKEIEARVKAFTESTRKNAKFAVGGVAGLYLRLNRFGENVSAQWIYRLQFGQDDRTIGLGGYPKVSLKQAREKASDMSRQRTSGIDPLEEKREAQRKAEQERQARKAAAMTFEKAALMMIEEKASYWAKTNANRERKSRYYLRMIAPVFGGKPVGAIDQDDVYKLMVTNNLYQEKTETAKKCREFVNQVCLWSVSKGWRSKNLPNPGDMRGYLGYLLEPLSTKKKGNYPSLLPSQAPEFFAELCSLPPSQARDSLIFIMLTGLRVQSAVGLAFEQINFSEGLAIIPPEKKKTKAVDFTCFLSSYAVDFLKAMPRLGEFVFPGRNWRDHQSEGTPKGAIKALNKRRPESEQWIDEDLFRRTGERRAPTPHGFRATLLTWALDYEHGNAERFPRLVVDLVLAHNEEGAKEDPFKGAYDRRRFPKERRDLMEQWGRYLVTGRYPNEDDGEPCEGWSRLLAGADRE